jgi:hypothetical protein
MLLATVTRLNVGITEAIATCGLAFLLLFCSIPAHAQSWMPQVEWFKPWGPCGGNCAVHGYVGQFTNTDQSAILGLNSSFIPDAGDFVPVWDYDWRSSYIAAMAFSRRVVSIGNALDIEIEAGAAQRFGRMDATEVWGAVYVRWTKFPWNKYLRTTVALSTGFNYATEIEWLERQRDIKSSGSRLLHFLSPEITFALPQYKELEFVFRIHHRSGGANIVGKMDIFNGVAAGAHHATAGVRYRF